MIRDFKPFRYLTPKPRQYLDVRKGKPKRDNEKNEEDNFLKNFGLVLIVMSALVGTGLFLDKCTKLEQKVENYYNQTIEERSNKLYEYQ